MALGGGAWVVEHRWEVRELVGESIWVEEGRKRVFRGGRRWRRLCPGELRWPERTEEGAGEHQWEVGIPFPGSVGAEGGRRWGLHGDVVLGGGNGGGGRRVAFLGKGKEERL